MTLFVYFACASFHAVEAMLCRQNDASTAPHAMHAITWPAQQSALHSQLLSCCYIVGVALIRVAAP